MCGIAGYINFDKKPAEPHVLKKMADVIRHRGPDDEGLYVDGHVGLAHRRLAIIDLSKHAHQPMAADNNNYILCYNGEIYNYQQIRTELQSLGYLFHSNSDTEVVLNALIEWGTGAIKKFNGMFAFAFWDKTQQKFILTRDRYGIKPLYICHSDNTLFFGSEIKAILQHPDLSVNIDLEGMVEYLTFQNFFTEKTLFQSITLFPPASVYEYSSNGSVKTEAYWDYDFTEPQYPLSRQEYIEETDRLFQQAVSRQLVGDVPVGAYLSGGIDSGSINAIAAKQQEHMMSFTVGFDMNSASGLELGFDERSSAEYMSYLAKTEHYEMVLKAGDMERCMKSLVWHLEEPRVGQSYPNYYAAQLASKFVKVVLAGTGGDELFGGYPWRYYRAVVNDDFEHYIQKYYLFWQRLIPNNQLKEIMSPVWDSVSHVWTQSIFKDVFKQHNNEFITPEDYINHSLYFEAKTFLQGLLVVEDKLSMAHSLENRVPFLDNDLVDFSMKIPASLKLGKLEEVVRINENEPGSKTQKYFQKNNDGKLILREVMKKYIPENISNAEKKGFSAPDSSWFRGESIEYIRDLLFSRSASLYNYFDYEKVTKLLDDHISGKINRRLLVWSFLYIEVFLNSKLFDL